MLKVDSVFIGDSLPTKEELKTLSALTKDYVTIRAKCLTQNQFIKDLLAKNVFTTRQDAAFMAIRTQESRLLCKNEKIYPEYISNRDVGMITMDNINSGRYMGELQIILKEQKQDKAVNIIGKILDSDMILLKYLKPGSKFKIELM